MIDTLVASVVSPIMLLGGVAHAFMDEMAAIALSARGRPARFLLHGL